MVMPFTELGKTENINSFEGKIKNSVLGTSREDGRGRES